MEKQETNRNATSECPFCNGTMHLDKSSEKEIFELEDNKVYVCYKHQQEILDKIIRGEL